MLSGRIQVYAATGPGPSAVPAAFRQRQPACLQTSPARTPTGRVHTVSPASTDAASQPIKACLQGTTGIVSTPQCTKRGQRADCTGISFACEFRLSLPPASTFPSGSRWPAPADPGASPARPAAPRRPPGTQARKHLQRTAARGEGRGEEPDQASVSMLLLRTTSPYHSPLRLRVRASVS